LVLTFVDFDGGPRLTITILDGGHIADVNAANRTGDLRAGRQRYRSMKRIEILL